MKSCLSLLLILIVTHFSLSAQRLKRADRAIVSNIQAYTTTLASKEMQGRKAGTAGERSAALYIAKQFERGGLKPMGDANSWLQSFGIYDGTAILPFTKLEINGESLQLYRDYLPFAFSASGQTTSTVSVALSERGVPWFKDLKEITDGNENTNQGQIAELIREKAAHAADKGATALIIYNSTGENYAPFDKMDSSGTTAIPVVFITKKVMDKYISDESAVLDINLNVALEQKRRTSGNIIGYANNGADSIIVATSNLNDDTGVAALIELVRLTGNIRSKSKNYLFIVYSGEQNGTYGSTFFKKHPCIDLQKISYILNVSDIKAPEQKIKGLGLVKHSMDLIQNNDLH